MNMPVIMNSKPKVLVTRRWPAAVEAQLAERFDTEFNRTDTPLTSAEFRSALARFDAILPTVTDKLGAEALDVSAPQTRLLANYGVGYSHIDADAVRTHVRGPLSWGDQQCLNHLPGKRTQTGS